MICRVKNTQLFCFFIFYLTSLQFLLLSVVFVRVQGSLSFLAYFLHIESTLRSRVCTRMLTSPALQCSLSYLELFPLSGTNFLEYI